jgi:D-alanine transaminase
MMQKADSLEALQIVLQNYFITVTIKRMTNSIVYLNGNYVDIQEARISPLDRGFLFGDSVYEVIPVYDNKLFTEKEHLDRLTASLGALHVSQPMSHDAWISIFNHLLSYPHPGDRMIYVQVTRGAYPDRAHASPAQIIPTVFVAALPVTRKDVSQGISAITVQDQRWNMCRIKATTLLANTLAKDAAQQAQTQDAIFIRDGFALEGTASNVFIVKNNHVITPPLSANILPGITRHLVIELLRKNTISVEEKMITLDELNRADEIWLTGSVLEIAPVILLDKHQVGDGKVGAIYPQVIQWYRNNIEKKLSVSYE